MRNRWLALLAAGLFILLGVMVGSGTQTSGAEAGAFSPPTTYATEPTGALGLYETLSRMGVKTARFRRPYRLLADEDSAARAPLLVVLAPGGLSRTEVRILTEQARSYGPLLLGGAGTLDVMNCYGWGYDIRGEDSIRVRTPAAPATAAAPWVRRYLTRGVPDTVDASKEAGYAGLPKAPCDQRVESVDTLLLTAGMRPVLVRLHLRQGFPVLLLADVGLLGNRSLKEHDLGPMLVRLISATGAVRFDEYHHGYDESGGLLGYVIDWSRGSPWGWGAWQLMIVGLLALGCAMIRTGPIISVIVRQRRSALEHVRALATALRAARGHDVAVDLLAHGLRRRLSRDGKGTRGPIKAWLQRLQDRVRTPRARAAVARLEALTRPGRSAHDVLAAANAVEDVWQELRP